MNLTKLITLAALGVSVGAVDLRNLGEEDSCSSTALTHESKIMAGYLTADYGTKVKISKAAKEGYNVVISSFIQIDGTAKPKFFNDYFNAYCGSWVTMNDTCEKAIKKDIKKAKDDYGLKYALVSTGGGDNLFNPAKSVSYETLATNIKDFLETYDFDGIDFDIEHLGHHATPAKNLHITEDYIYKLIKELRKQKSDIIITGAPQVNQISETTNGVSKNVISFVNGGTDNLYKKAAKANNCFDYLFAQEYNTANYAIKDGAVCDSVTTEGCFTQKNVEFMKHSFPALKKQVHANTRIVMGQPAVSADGVGTQHIFYGPSKDTVYSSLATVYESVADENDSKFGGAMTWQLGSDKGNSWKFVKAIEPKVVNAVANRT